MLCSSLLLITIISCAFIVLCVLQLSWVSQYYVGRLLFHLFTISCKFEFQSLLMLLYCWNQGLTLLVNAIYFFNQLFNEIISNWYHYVTLFFWSSDSSFYCIQGSRFRKRLPITWLRGILWLCIHASIISASNHQDVCLTKTCIKITSHF